MNPDTQYQNGVDFHLDWGASQFISKSVHIGPAGYLLQQISPDSRPGAKLGAFEGRAVGIGPQIGFMFPLGEHHSGYLNLRAYRDLETENRPDGYSVWAQFVLSPAAEPKPQTATRMLTK